MTMTPDAKKSLSSTIRALRGRLLEDLHVSTETAYRLGVRMQDAGLDEASKRRRTRLETWMADEERSQPAGKDRRTRDAFRADAEKQAAYTWLNRLVILRLMEIAKLRKPAVVTGGWESQGYKDFRSIAPALVRGDDTEGYGFLLELVFQDLATELPGIFGSAGVADLVPMPPATLRHVVEALDKPELESCWTDDMTLGWVYQYWNDPEREDIDTKLNGGGKLERHEIASKTQMFTERYMVDWLLQNSLGPMWLAMCQKHGWTPQVQADGTLDTLEERRTEFRATRDAGKVDLTELMPLHTDAEHRWAYYVPQAIPQDAVEQAPETIRNLKILDPAVGSGHFLVVAFDLLVALYLEEAQHRGEQNDPKWSNEAIVERILEHNLHGIDLDPRAVQFAAAALWLKARVVCPNAKPRKLNLVASNLKLSSLPDDDPALIELRNEVERETGIPASLTDTIIGALKGADHLGSLLKVDSTVDTAIEEMAGGLGRVKPEQGDLLSGFSAEQKRLSMSADAAKESLLSKLEGFLSKQTSGDDLGLRLRGEQLAAGVRFVRLVKEGAYDLVVANPPYQGTSKMADSKYIEKHYPLGKADLYAAFLLRGLQLVRKGGVSAMLTMRNWMFIKQYSGLRESLLKSHDLRALGDFDRGAFEDVPDEVVSVAVSAFRKGSHHDSSMALCPTPREDRTRDSERTHRKRAATLCHVGRHEFDPAALKVVPEWPLVYWWGEEFIHRYGTATLIGDVAPARMGSNTGNNARFLRRPWEPHSRDIRAVQTGANTATDGDETWVPYVKGAQGKRWWEGLENLLLWKFNALEVKTLVVTKFGEGGVNWKICNSDFYFKEGVSYSTIGASFTARCRRYKSVFDVSGSSVFPPNVPNAVCLMNSRTARAVISALNPTVNFQVADANRIPLWPITDSHIVYREIDLAFTLHESHREPSVEFTHPGPSPWRHAQDWAQLAVDRPEGDPLPEYIEELDPEPPTDHVSFALGVALGRLGPSQEGILDPATADLSHALPSGICFLDGTLDKNDKADSLGHNAAKVLQTAWDTYGSQIDTKTDLRTWLRLNFFGDVHKGMYENRPIHWPLCSAKKTFVAWVNIHRMNEQTLRVLLADHLHPSLTRIEGQLTDLRTTRDGADKKSAREAEKRFATLQKAKAELDEFIATVGECADKGAPPTDASATKCPSRETDARYPPNLDDGVMINSAGLWPLLDPIWNKPKAWFKELSQAKGRKDYDWSHLAMRYWPTRVDKKCQEDPSLGVAHGCFWKYHPARAWAWELRLQDEIGQDFKIEEASYRGDEGDVGHREAYLRDHAQEALAAAEKEILRRRGRGKDAKPVAELRLLEPGLWSALPDECWALEERIIEKQEASFTLVAPDEEEARAAYLIDNPMQKSARTSLVGRMQPKEMFTEAQQSTAP